jgi:AcrR family transcriptional regulator
LIARERQFALGGESWFVFLMPYRRTPNVVRRLAAREQAIMDAALQLAAEGGLQAVHIAAVADRAGIAAGTVYRYFPAKTDLVAAVIASVSGRELAAMRAAADAAPGPLSAIAAGIATFAARALAERRLIWAVTAEPVEVELDALRLDFRKALVAELQVRIDATVSRTLLPQQDPRVTAPALIGAVIEGLLGPLAPTYTDPITAREAVQSAALLVLRALGVIDPRARGLVVQTALPIPSSFP